MCVYPFFWSVFRGLLHIYRADIRLSTRVVVTPARTRIRASELSRLHTLTIESNRSIDHVMMMMTTTTTMPTMPTTRMAPRAGKTTTRTQVRA